MHSHSSSENVGQHIATKMAEFDEMIAESIMQSIGSSSSSTQLPIVAETPCTPPRNQESLLTSMDSDKNKGTHVNEEEKEDSIDLLLQRQFANVVPSPVKITKTDNPLVCALKFFVLGSNPRIALAISIQNLPSVETQQGMQGNKDNV